MKKKEKVYEGKAKKLYLTEDEDKLIMEYKDDATAFDGQKKGQIEKKGARNAEISKIFFELLEKKGVPTHYLKQLSETELLVKRVEIVPVEVAVRNIAAGSLVDRLGYKEGEKLEQTIVEFYYKSDELGDPLLNREHILLKGLASEAQLEKIEELGKEINDFLFDFLAERGIDLVDFKLEFGTDEEGDIYLADEISPDTCRFWDSKTEEKLDKDRFRRDLGQVENAYKEILNRLKKGEDFGG